MLIPYPMSGNVIVTGDSGMYKICEQLLGAPRTVGKQINK